MNQRMISGLLLSGTLIGALVACSGEPTSAPRPSTPSVSSLTPSAPSSSPVDDLPPGSVVGPPAVRVLTLVSSASAGSRLSVVGPKGAKYRLRIGKAVDSCSQIDGRTDSKPLPGLPPNATHNAALKCATGADRGSVIKTSALLVSVDGGDGFSVNFEVALDRDL